MSQRNHKSDSSWCEQHKRKKRPRERGLNPNIGASSVCNVCEFLERREAELAA